MKRILLLYSALLATTVAFSGTNLKLTKDKKAAVAFEDARYIYKTLPVGSKPDLEISNKYGNINIELWDKDSISFDVEIKISSNHLEKLEEMFDLIDVKFSNSASYVAAETVWGNTGKLKGTTLDIKKMLGSNDKISVNYTIRMPKTTDIEIDNKFGDIMLPLQLNDVEIYLSHGSIRGKNIRNAKKIDLRYGKLRLDHVEKGDFVLKFSDANIQSCSKINIESTSSHIDIDKAGSVVLNSKHDRLRVEEIESLTITASLSDIDIEVLKRDVNGSLKFGGLSIDKALGSFTNFKLEGNNTDISIGFAPSVSFDYNVWLENGKAFRVTESKNRYTKNQNNANSQIFEGTFGKSGSGKTITISLKNSYVGFEVAD